MLMYLSQNPLPLQRLSQRANIWGLPQTEIYQIVSAKALDQNESAPQIGDRGRVLEISKQADPPKTDGKCC